ncbi:MAG: TauD/TfdA family dioxygenase [Pseudomonadota bacterium]
MKFLSEPTTECSAWIPDDLLDDDSWDYTLTQGQADELVAALGGIKRAGLALHQIRAENFPLESCGVLAKDIATSLREGRGFALLHNFPVAGFSREDIEKMYWGFCTHLGRGVTQNSDGSLIHYVTEGRLRPNQGTRSVGNPGKVSLHVDLADCVSLLCLRQAKGSPRSRLASSTALYNHLLEQAPESLARLSEGFVWDRQDEHGASELPTTGYRVPFFSVADGQISCRYNRNWIRRAAQREADGLSSADESLLDLIDELAHAH